MQAFINIQNYCSKDAKIHYYILKEIEWYIALISLNKSVFFFISEWNTLFYSIVSQIIVCLIPIN